MITIHKYTVPVTVADRDVTMPLGAKIVQVGSQVRSTVCFWAIVDLQNESETRRFRVIRTGYEIEGGAYVGTAFDNGFVWHLFEV